MRFLRRGKRHTITLFGKPGCHLCDEAHARLVSLMGKAGHDVTIVDITSDPAVYRRYDVVIPVIVVDGTQEFQAPISWDKLRTALR